MPVYEQKPARKKVVKSQNDRRGPKQLEIENARSCKQKGGKIWKGLKLSEIIQARTYEQKGS